MCLSAPVLSMLSCLQELRPYLQSHRSWLSGLWASSSNSASFESRKEQALLLSQLLGSLLKCCNPEVMRLLAWALCAGGYRHEASIQLTCLYLISMWISSGGSFVLA